MDREPSTSGLTIVSKKGMDPILLVVLYCKPYGRVNTVDVLKEALFVGFLVDDKVVIHIPVPEPGGQYLKLFVLSTPCTVPENTSLLQDLINSMRNLHQNYTVNAELQNMQR